MKTLRLGMMVVGLLSLACGTVLSQDKKEPPAEPKVAEPKPTASEIEEWAKLSGPGEEHKRLDPLVGKWTMVLRSRGEVEGQWEESKGTTEFRWILGGRFLMEEAKCDFAGTSFEWISLYGYDKDKKKYTAVWADNFGTTTEAGQCDADPSGKVFPYACEQLNPITGKMTKFTWTITLESPTAVRADMFEPGPDGKETKVMELIMTKP